MIRKTIVILFIHLTLVGTLFAQGEFKSEADLKEKAAELFEAGQFVEANPLYAQLLSLYPQDPEYNYKYGACLLATEGDKQKPMKYLEFATSKSGVDPVAIFYLGKAHHLNYNFAKAVKYYSRFKNKVSPSIREKYEVERNIEMCKNGNKLLSKINDVQVVERSVLPLESFYQAYKLEGINGKISTTPEDFRTKLDKKKNEKSLIFLPINAKEVYFASYGKKGDNKDIYKAIKLGNGDWSEPVVLGSSINTPYDEDYAYIHPDGRTLYFASKGHSSMGGYDLFKSTLDATTGQWTEPENLDFAFSSADDDIMFITNENKSIAYFASSRSNEAGKITVYKVLVDKKPADLSVIKGKFIAENSPTLKRAKVTVVDKSTNETIGVYNTDANGNYSIEITENGGSYQFSLETTDDAPIHTGVVNIPKQDEFEVLGQELRLVGSGSEQQLVIKNIFDGTTAANRTSSGPQVSSEVLRLKANLDVNYSASQLQDLVQKDASQGELATTNNDSQGDASTKVEDGSIGTSKEVEANSSASENGGKNASSAVGENVLSSRLKSSHEEIKVTIEEKENQQNKVTAAAKEYSDEAKRLFNEKKDLEQNSASTAEISKKKTAAELAALKAGLMLQTAQQIEKDLSEDKSIFSGAESKKEEIASLIENGDLVKAESELGQLEETYKEIEPSANVVQGLINKLGTDKQESENKIIAASAKKSSFVDEKENIANQIKTLNTDLESAAEGEKSALNEKVEQLSIDLKDIEFQESNANREYEEEIDNSKALLVKEEVLKKVEGIIENKTETSTTAQISSTEKNKLEEEIMAFQKNGQMAYTSNSSSISTISSAYSENTSSQNSDIGSTATLNGINDRFEKKVSAVQGTSDPDLKAAQEIEIYDEWINTLETAVVEKESLMNELSDANKKGSLRSEIEGLQGSIDAKTAIRNRIEEQMAQNTLSTDALASGENVNGVNNSSLDSDAGNSANTSSTSTDGATPSNTSSTSSDGLNSTNNVSIDAAVTSSFNNSLSNGGSENLTTYESVVKSIEGKTGEEIESAKSALQQANALEQQVDQARQTAYNLPSVEERTAAFDRASALKRRSEEKKLEAAAYLAAYNKREYNSNRNKIDNANQYDADFESSNLDIANLLEEEAEVYFFKAADIRSTVDEQKRLSTKDVILQKAYDYELLALKKQTEAMDKLNLAYNEYTNPALSVQGANQSAISDPEVLAITEASLAKQLGDSLSSLSTNLRASSDDKLAEANATTDETQRDSLLAISQQLLANAQQDELKASVYYQRERQLDALANALEPSLAAGTPLRPRTISNARVVNLDTVTIEDDRKEVVLNSRAFVIYAQNQRDRERIFRDAEVEYNKAIAFNEEKLQLIKQAKEERAQAEETEDENEKQRLIKSAEVIDQRVVALEKSIDSINTIVKVKNFLLANAEQKMENSLNSVSSLEQQEIVQLSKSYTGELASIPGEDLAITTNAQSGSAELGSQETSGSNPNLASLGTDVINPTEIPVNDAGNGSPDVVGSPTSSSSGGSNPSGGTSNSSGNNPSSSGNNTNSNVGRNIARSTNFPTTKAIEPSSLPFANKLSLEEIDRVPRELKQAIFVTLGAKESAYDVSKPIPLSPEMPAGLVYKVQVGAFRNPIAQNLFKGFAPLAAEKAGNGITRYTAGLFVALSNAIQARNEIRKIGYPDAFVVAFLDGKRISIAQARNVGGETVVDNASTTNTTNTTNTSSSSTNTLNRVEGGNKEGLSQRFAENTLQEVVNTKTIDGVYYTVQIGVFSKPLQEGTFPYTELNVVELGNGLIRYNAGIFNTALEAADLKITVNSKIKDAFVTAYYNGKRISLNEASRLKNQ